MPKTKTQSWPFVIKINDTKLVLRKVNGSPGRAENVAEHSWSVATMCWLLAPELEKEFGKHLDVNKMIKMSLMHDLVEILVGDASIFTPELRKNKEKKEEKAARKLFSTLPIDQKKEMLSLWHEFEELKSLEARTVRGFDKISGVIQRIISGQGWGNVHGTTKKLDELIIDKLVFSKTMVKYYDQLKDEAVRKKLIIRE